MTHHDETRCKCGGDLEQEELHFVSKNISHGMTGMTVRDYRCSKCNSLYESREYIYPKGAYPMGMVMYLNRLIERIAKEPIDFRNQDREFYRTYVKCSWCFAQGNMELPKDIKLGAVPCPRCGKPCLSTNLEAKVLK